MLVKHRLTLFLIILNLHAMKKSDVLEFFGTVTAVAAAAGVSIPAVSQWGERVPLGSAAVLERVTRGRLKLNLDDYRHLPDRQAAA